ncbi:MAG: exo-beta-N-acetylmuramidase NamZ domain-containing protein [Parvicellaceae bacterium]
MYIKYKHQHFKEYFKLSKYLLLLFLTYSTILISQNKVIVGAERPELYLNTLLGKRVGLVANQTSKVKKEHLVDVLLNEGVNVVKVFSPEHGFRGKSDAGEKVKDEIDLQTGLPIYSLYGKSKRKPSKEILKDIDIIVFDLQDVGVRFYTYISSLHYVMEACAENNVQLIVLDRPNPNGFYVDGPILDLKFRSFVGMHPVPVVHGMTIGEYAKMINGEKWLDNMIQCSLEIIPCLNYNHNTRYVLPIPPSPNLPNMRSVYLYPSLCFFEGTNISIGRGTNFPFQVFGAPYFSKNEFSFTPKSTYGSKNPKYKSLICYGTDLRTISIDSLKNTKKLNLNWLVNSYKISNESEDFFNKNNFFILLSGTDKLMNLVKGGASPKHIYETYQKELNNFKSLRKHYLMYDDFE